MKGRPPRSPLFPCTTFSRSDLARARVDRDDGWLGEHDSATAHVDERVGRAEVDRHVAAAEAGEVPEEAHVVVAWSSARRRRSEEHTSELQSRQYLVCRLLLE